MLTRQNLLTSVREKLNGTDPVLIARDILKQLLAVAERPDPPREPSDADRAVAEYGPLLLKHDEDPMHCDEVWPKLLRARSKMDDAARAIARGEKPPKGPLPGAHPKRGQSGHDDDGDDV